MIKIPSQTVKIGRMNRLQVVTELDFGMYLDGKKYGEILLPRKYIPEGTQVDDFVDVFVYMDSEDRPIATTETPYAMEGELAYLKAVAISSIGAFLDWGLLKDLLVPYREQRERINETDIGYTVIIDKKCIGMIYKKEIFQDIEEGQSIKGFIKLVRPDGKIDAELQPSGGNTRDELAELILKDLKEGGGFLPLTDRTPPEVINDRYKVSKRAYKRAVGGLYKQRKISIDEDGLRLV
jgi:predicted RNA-binding protein (virulence factor B family)